MVSSIHTDSVDQSPWESQTAAHDLVTDRLRVRQVRGEPVILHVDLAKAHLQHPLDLVDHTPGGLRAESSTEDVLVAVYTLEHASPAGFQQAGGAVALDELRCPRVSRDVVELPRGHGQFVKILEKGSRSGRDDRSPALERDTRHVV